MSTWTTWSRRAKKVLAHPNPMRFVASRVLWHSRLSSLFTAKLSDGLVVRFYPSSISAALWVENDSRNEDAEFLRTVLRAGDAYVDCGANVGHLAIVARHVVGATGSVTAIEANPRIFEYCVGNLRLNAFYDVLAVNVALGDARGTVEISDGRADDQNYVGTQGTSVPMRPLDEVLGAAPITLLKIDVEGFEVAVLRGATRTLARAKFVYCELSSSNSARFGFSPAEAEEILLAAGFVFVRRDGDRWQVTDRGVFATLAPEDQPATGYNLVAVKRDAVDDLQARVAAHGKTLTR